MGLWDWFRKKEPNTFELTESMWGFMTKGAASYREGYEAGKRDGTKLMYEVTLHVKNFKEFRSATGKRAPMTGWVSCKLFGTRLPISNGEYGLYWTDPETGRKQITYRFDFIADDGRKYRFSGYKVIESEPWVFDVLEDQTTLYATVSEIVDTSLTETAKGIIHYHIEDFPEMLSSIRAPENDTVINRIMIGTRFFRFVAKEIGEYFKEFNPFYEAEYTNFVCRGAVSSNGADTEFFFFSGAHDKGFPWGDNVSFWDIGLIIRQGDEWKRFVLTERSIETMKLRLSEGLYEYQGPLFELNSGYQISFSEMHEEPPPPHIKRIDARIALRFTPKQIGTKNIPFQLDHEKAKELPEESKKKISKSGFLAVLDKRRGDPEGLGYTTQISRLTDMQGEFVFDGVTYAVRPEQTLGEGEFGRLAGLRRPSLYYNYFCAIEPDADIFRIHVRSGVLRSLTADLLTHEVENLLGSIIGQTSRMDVFIKSDEKVEIAEGEGDMLITSQGDLLEINNDHFPTGIFQRRIVAVPGSDSSPALALEEDMSSISMESIKSEKMASVAAIKDPDRLQALSQALDSTGFFDLLDRTQRDSGKSKEDFSIIIKPNFSFMYSLADVSTFTDPRLVEHLVDQIFNRGYRKVAVAEAQSTYASFFTNRDVPTLARYIGLMGRNYSIIDLSEGTVPHDYGRTLGQHEVHPAWRDADFRISFAKNKTHSYAFYTLAIKNIYGALPRQNKFREYHCNKDLGIYAPAIDYLEAFPVHYALIDAYISADGPFGIFADVEPNFTSTIIAGDDIVAVDWVGASKMGYDPMISDYMKLAVERFGKPHIRLVGDHSTYSNWRNVPEVVSKAAFGIMDRNFVFGDFLYSAMASMDPFFKFTPGEVGRKAARLLSAPMRKILFEWVRGNKEKLTRDDLKKMLKPDQLKYMESVLKAMFE